MRSLVISIVLLAAASAARLPDACARLDMPDVLELRQECDAATRKEYSMPVEWYIERAEHVKLNASRTLPDACGDKAREDECAAELTARTKAAIKAYEMVAEEYKQAVQQYQVDTADIAARINNDRVHEAPFMLANLAVLVISVYFLCTSSRSRRS